MKKDNYKIQVGDKLYQASKSYHKVFEWEILEIWLEAYLSGFKTIVRCSNGTWSEKFFASDVVYFYDTREEAERALRATDTNVGDKGVIGFALGGCEG